MEFWGFADDRRSRVCLSMEPAGCECLMGPFGDADRLDYPHRMRRRAARAVDTLPAICKFPDVAEFAGTPPADADLLCVCLWRLSLGSKLKSDLPARRHTCLLSNDDHAAGLLADADVSRKGVRSGQQQAHYKGRD